MGEEFWEDRNLWQLEPFTSAKICSPLAPTLKKDETLIWCLSIPFTALKIEREGGISLQRSPICASSTPGMNFFLFSPETPIRKTELVSGGAPKETPNHLAECKFLKNIVLQVILFLPVLCLVINFTFHSLFHHLLQLQRICHWFSYKPLFVRV